MDTAVFLLLTLLALALLYGIARKLRRKRRKHWESFARQHGLRYDAPGGVPEVTGRLDGRPFELRLARRSSDGDVAGIESVEMAVTLPQGAPKESRVRSASSMVRKVSDAVSEQSIQTGDPGFDEHFTVQGESSLDYLTAPRRQALSTLAEHSEAEWIELQGDRLSLFHRSVAAEREMLDRNAELLKTAAKALEGG